MNKAIAIFYTVCFYEDKKDMAFSSWYVVRISSLTAQWEYAAAAPGNHAASDLWGPRQLKLDNSYEATWKGVKASLHSRLAPIIIIDQWRLFFMEISRGLGWFFPLK